MSHLPAPYHFHWGAFLHDVWTGAVALWLRTVHVAGLLFAGCGLVLAANWRRWWS